MIKALALENIFSPVLTKQQSRASKNKFAVGVWFFVSCVFIVANCILLVSYIYGVNKYAAKGYEIKQLQTKLAVLNESNKKINLKISEATSMVSIQSDFLNSGFISAGTPRFLEVRQFTQR